MYQSSRPQPYYPTSGGSLFSSRLRHGLKVGSGGPLWKPLFDCKSLHLLFSAWFLYSNVPPASLLEFLLLSPPTSLVSSPVTLTINTSFSLVVPSLLQLRRCCHSPTLPIRTGDSPSPPISLVRSVAPSCSVTRSKSDAYPRSTVRFLISFFCSIAIFASTPSSAAGTVGAIFNSALQLGSAVGIAAVTSIQTSIDGDVNPASPPIPTTEAGWKDAYRGRAAGYWFSFAAVVLVTLAVLVFFRSHAIPSDEEREEARERKLDEEALDNSRGQPTRV